MDSNVPLATYTSTRIVKSFPSGIRQDSSNIDPMESVRFFCDFSKIGERWEKIMGLADMWKSPNPKAFGSPGFSDIQLCQT